MTYQNHLRAMLAVLALALIAISVSICGLPAFGAVAGGIALGQALR